MPDDGDYRIDVVRTAAYAGDPDLRQPILRGEEDVAVACAGREEPERQGDKSAHGKHPCPRARRRLGTGAPGRPIGQAAQLGGRTLVVEADLRGPRQHLVFNVENSTGLSSVLAGHVDSRVIQPASSGWLVVK